MLLALVLWQMEVMFRIKYLTHNNLYQLHSTCYGAFEGSKIQIMAKALKMGMVDNELVLAFLDMEENGTKIAEFGAAGYFLYSHN